MTTLQLTECIKTCSFLTWGYNVSPRESQRSKPWLGSQGAQSETAEGHHFLLECKFLCTKSKVKKTHIAHTPAIHTTSCWVSHIPLLGVCPFFIKNEMHGFYKSGDRKLKKNYVCLPLTWSSNPAEKGLLALYASVELPLLPRKLCKSNGQNKSFYLTCFLLDKKVKFLSYPSCL